MSTHHALELSEQTQASLDFLANHDIKAAAFPALVTEGPLTTTGLATVMTERIGAPLKSAVSTYPDTYVKGGFAKIDEGPLHRGQPTRLFSSIKDEAGLAAVGALMGWSEEHDIPLITALSSSASKGSKSPTNTVQLLEGMLSGANIGQIEGSRYKPSPEGLGTQHNTRLHQMVRSGLVIVTDPDPEFKILDPSYRGNRSFESLPEGQRSVYTVLKAAQLIDEASDRKWSLMEIEQLAAELKLVNPDDAQAWRDFHGRLVRAISVATPEYIPGAVEKVEIGKRQYSVAPVFQNAAAALVDTVVQLDRSAQKRTEFVDKALDIYLDDETLARIVRRGLDTSPYINADRSGTKNVAA